MKKTLLLLLLYVPLIVNLILMDRVLLMILELYVIWELSIMDLAILILLIIHLIIITEKLV